MKYAADCEQAFGYFLHHYPYVGMRGEDDEQFRLDSGNRMRDLYEATFGEAYPGAAAEAGAGDVATAYCAGPHIQALARAGEGAVAGTAYCAGPHSTAKGARAEVATAYCAGPHATTAYCAGPHATAKAACAEVATAYCAGPHATTAYCAGPHTRAAAR
jgi:sarcosine oxidase gamma subunit